MHKKNKIKDVLAIVIALALLLPGAVAVANDGTNGEVVTPSSDDSGGSSILGVGITWNATLIFTETGGMNEWAVFGEAPDANDGPPADTYDTMKPPGPPLPRITSWFDDSLPYPNELLCRDYRHYPDTSKVWDLTVVWEPKVVNETSVSTDITISWDTSDILASEYNSVALYDVAGASVVANMLVSSEYTFASPWAFVDPPGVYVVIPKEFEIRAAYETYTLAVDTDGTGIGCVTLDPPGGVYEPGVVVDLTANPDSASDFIVWSGDDIDGSIDPTETITMNDDKAVTATFNLKEYTLTVNTDGTGSGTVTEVPDLPTHTHGSSVQLTANENFDSDFIVWTGDDIGGSANPIETIFMDGNKEVTATFNLKEYTLIVNIDGTGEVTLDPLPIGGTYSHGTEVELTASTLLDPDWSFIKWTGDLDGSVNPETIIMDGDKEVTAWFMEGWTATLVFSANIASIRTDDLSFGESGSALDGIDDFDLPKSPSPPTAPYVYAWFTTTLAIPYDILWGDYREFPADQQVWDVWVEVDTTTGGTTPVKIAWDTAEMIASGYAYVGLHDGLSNELIVDMQDVSCYWFTSTDKWQHHFKIVCSNIGCPEAFDDGPYTTNEAVALHVSAEDGVLINDTDINVPGPLPLTAHIDTTVSSGNLILNTDGSFVYTPNLGFSGTDSFTYTAFDGLCHSNPATVTITVIALNHIALQRGWNLISNPVDEPIDKTDIIVRLNNIDRTWDQAVACGIIIQFIYGWNVNTYTFEDVLVPGEGYWIWSNYNCEFLIPSNVEADDHITDLDASWNLVGLPNDIGLDKIDINIYYNGLLYTWDDAVTAGIIIDFVYSWDRTNQNYVITGTFELGFGYWMYAYHGCALKIA